MQKWDKVIVKSWEKEYKWEIHAIKDESIYGYKYVVITDVWQYVSVWHVNDNQLTLQIEDSK